MISTMKFREFGSRAEASEALAETIAHALGAALDSGGRASFVASGGGSPRETYERLGRSAIDWRRVSVIPSDERLVPVGSSRHNLSMIRKTLGTEAAFVELTLQTDIDTLRPFDAALFGMGDDGHTASLFPDDPEIDAALRSRGNTHEAHVPRMPEARISLTPCALAERRHALPAYIRSKEAGGVGSGVRTMPCVRVSCNGAARGARRQSFRSSGQPENSSGWHSFNRN